MAFIDFSLTDKTLYNKQRDWREQGKTEAQICDMTGAWLKETAGAPRVGLTRFPKWLRTFLDEQVKSINGSMRHDADNDVFKVSAPMSLLDVDDFLNSFSDAYVKLIGDDKDKQAFVESFQLHPSVTEADEEEKMADLENHARGAAKRPERAPKDDRVQPIDEDDDDEEVEPESDDPKFGSEDVGA